ILDPWDARQLRPVEGASRQDDEAGTDVVAAIGADPPALERLVPTQVAYLGGEDRSVIQPEVLADPPAVLVDLGAVGELLRRNEIELFEHRDVTVRIVVALDSGEAVPVPNATEVAAHLDDAHIVDIGFLEVSARQESGDTAAEDRDIDVLRDRVARRHRRMR